MAWRPLYHPQVGQTTWGSLALWHWGQMLRAGRLSFQADARRLRLLAFEVFFLGTAMAVGAVFSVAGCSDEQARRGGERQILACQPELPPPGGWSTSRAAHRGSGATGGHKQSPSLRSSPQLGHRPRQPSSQRGAIGMLRRSASRTMGRRSSISPTSGYVSSSWCGGSPGCRWRYTSLTSGLRMPPTGRRQRRQRPDQTAVTDAVTSTPPSTEARTA